MACDSFFRKTHLPESILKGWLGFTPWGAALRHQAPCSAVGATTHGLGPDLSHQKHEGTRAETLSGASKGC